MILKWSDNNKFIFLLLLIPVLIAYYPVMSHDFLYSWDDQWVVINHYTSGGINFNNLYRILTDFYHGQYAPLNEFNYLLLYSIFGYKPVAFHLASLCWHMANVLLVYVFISRLLEQSVKFTLSKGKLIAFGTALLWGIHPVNVESVAWISASKVLIYACFYLIALLCYLKYVKTKHIVSYWTTILFFFFSFLGKEQVVTLPLVLLLLDWITGRDLKSKDVWIEKLPFFILSVFFGLVTILSQGDGGGAPVYPMYQRYVFGCYTLFEYVVKCIFPVNLLYMYPFPIQVGESLPIRFLIYPPIVVVLIYCLYLFRKKAGIIFMALFFILHLGVALHVIPISRFAMVADRYAYLSCIAVVFLFSWALVYWIQMFSFSGKLLLSSLCVLYILYLGFYTNVYSKDWKDTDSVKRNLRELLERRVDYQKNENMKNLMHEHEHK